nr:SbcC/MukB-like Walker B domain-containing protein [Halomonas socia]
MDDAKQARDTAQQQRDTLLGEYRAVEAALAQGHKELEETERRLASARSALQEHPLYSELAEVNEAQRDAWLRAQQDDSESRRRRERQTLDALARAETELAPLEDTLRQDELALTRLAADNASADQRLAELNEQLPPLREQRDTLAQRLAEMLGEHATPDAWQQRLDAALESARQAREQALTQQHGAEQTRQRLVQQEAYQTEQLNALRQERETLTGELDAWRSAHPGLDDATLARLLAESEEEAQQQERQLEAADQARQRAAATLTERRTALLEHRRGQGLLDTEDDEALRDERVEAELAHLRQNLDEGRRALAPQLEAAQQARDGAAFALGDDDRKRARQQAGQAEREAARAEHRRWGQISELIGSADGKLFRRIAQAYNLEQLLEHANLHLAGLSRRYRLVRGGSELGLLVVDHDMGDERRSVHSLSGGETFLVSLALALGLASMASGELTIESLFIDEGFGSLDPQSLALAMEALDGLQALGRRVGVISHVQEMHERIPVQIQVEPLGNGTSRARLVSA